MQTLTAWAVCQEQNLELFLSHLLCITCLQSSKSLQHSIPPPPPPNLFTDITGTVLKQNCSNTGGNPVKCWEVPGKKKSLFLVKLFFMFQVSCFFSSILWSNSALRCTKPVHTDTGRKYTRVQERFSLFWLWNNLNSSMFSSILQLAWGEILMYIMCTPRR